MPLLSFELFIGAWGYDTRTEDTSLLRYSFRTSNHSSYAITWSDQLKARPKSNRIEQTNTRVINCSRSARKASSEVDRADGSWTVPWWSTQLMSRRDEHGQDFHGYQYITIYDYRRQSFNPEIDDTRPYLKLVLHNRSKYYLETLLRHHRRTAVHPVLIGGQPLLPIPNFNVKDLRFPSSWPSLINKYRAPDSKGPRLPIPPILAQTFVWVTPPPLEFSAASSWSLPLLSWSTMLLGTFPI